MIQITKAAELALIGIKEGYTSTSELGGFLRISRESATARVARLRKAGLVKAKKRRLHTNSPCFTLELSVTGAPYELLVGTRGAKPKIMKETKPKTYAEQGEDTFDSLNNYLYPNR